MQVIATVMIAVTEKCRDDIREKIEQIMQKAGAKEEWAILSGVKTTYYQFTGNQNDPLIKMYFEQKKNIEQNTGEKRRERTGSAEQKRSRKEPSREQEELFGSVIREMFP